MAPLEALSDCLAFLLGRLGRESPLALVPSSGRTGAVPRLGQKHTCNILPLNTLTLFFSARTMPQNDVRTVSLATEGDELALNPGQNLGVHLLIIKEQLDNDGTLLRGVSA